MGIIDDIRYAFRSLRRRPGFTAFAVLTVSLGVGAATAIFSTVEAVLVNPLPYDGGDRMVGLFNRVGPNAQVYTSPTRAQRDAWSRQTDLFEALEGWSITYLTFTAQNDEPQLITGARVRPSFFDLLGRSPLLGRAFTESELTGDGDRVALLSHAFWQNALGANPDVVGRTVRLEGEAWTVIGVMPPRTLVPGWGLNRVEAWLPLAETINGESLSATALLAEGVDIDVVNQRLEEIGDGAEGTGKGFGYASLVSEQVARGLREMLQLLMGAVIVLLLISCVNVANLLLFRANARKRETAVRSALGGGSVRLARQLVVESLILAGVGGALGVVLARVGQRAILTLRPSELDILDGVGIDGPVLLFAVVVTLGTGLLFGLLPALQAARPDALAPLRSGARVGGDVVGRRARWALVVAEVALSFALLLGSTAVITTLVRRQTGEVGYEAERVLFMDLTPPSWRFPTESERGPLYERIEARLQQLPGVERVTRASGIPPHTGIIFGKLEVEGSDPTDDTQILRGPSVGPGYFASVGQAIVQGRDFAESDVEGGESVMIVGESTARQLFPDREPVGGHFRMSEGAGWTTVIGVVSDVAMNGLNPGRPVMQVYSLIRERGDYGGMVIRVAPGQDVDALTPLIRDVVRSVDAEIRIDTLAPATDLLRETLTNERFLTTLLTTFAGLALVLAAIGLYGVVSQVVGQRTREIGIRIALGARRREVSGLVLRGAALATVAGVTLGIGLALAVVRVLDTRFFGLEANTPSTYVMAAAALSAATLLAAFTPTRRAAAVDPVEAMRTE